MIKRKIPTTMATQHPDNASAPFWERDGDGFVSTHEELSECLACFNDLGVDEFMWDWEGKHADEAVMDKLFHGHYDFLKKHRLGRDKFLTFRLPNIWQEKGHSLIRALLVILTAEDLARDLKFKNAPLFEVILPMAERADQLIYIQKSFKKLAHFKNEIFSRSGGLNGDYLEMIPLIESVEGQISIREFLNRYLALHKREFKRPPEYIRPFFARSDPAEVSGLLATVLAGKIGLSEAYEFSRENKIPVFPILGAGSLPFRGGLNPDNLDNFLNEYAGVRTVTIQSAFRYDYPVKKVRRSLEKINGRLPKLKPRLIPAADSAGLKKIIAAGARIYQTSLAKIISELEPIFHAVPRRRERKLHIGLLAYQRKAGRLRLPRAINFTAAFYSLGVPPEFIGLGRLLKSLDASGLNLINKYYLNLKSDLTGAGAFLNFDNLAALSKVNPSWRDILDDVLLTQAVLGIKLGPKTAAQGEHKNLSAAVWRFRQRPAALSRLIGQSGKIRKSLG